MPRQPKPEWHSISSVDGENRVGVCSICGPIRVRMNRWRHGRQSGRIQWRCKNAIRSKPSEVRHRKKARPKWTGRAYRLHVTELCARCGFRAEDLCQLDVDHIDGDHANDAPENLQTLCANCHRLKTTLERMPPEVRAMLWRPELPRPTP